MKVDPMNPKLIWNLKVPSKSNPGTFHTVEIYDSGDTRCDEECRGYQLKQRCSHCEKAKDYIRDLVKRFSKKRFYG